MFLHRFLFQHVPQLRPTTQPRAPVVDIIQSIKCISGHVHGFYDVAAEDPGAVDSIVQALEFWEGFVAKRVNERLISDIAGFVENLGGRIDPEDGVACLWEGVRVDVCDGDPGAAGACEPFCDCGTDTYVL
jgi:hypothetical protein